MHPDQHGERQSQRITPGTASAEMQECFLSGVDLLLKDPQLSFLPSSEHSGYGITVFPVCKP